MILCRGRPRTPLVSQRRPSLRSASGSGRTLPTLCWLAGKVKALRSVQPILLSRSPSLNVLVAGVSIGGTLWTGEGLDEKRERHHSGCITCEPTPRLYDKGLPSKRCGLRTAQKYPSSSSCSDEDPVFHRFVPK